ncbi:MAG: Uma2 family endonuclease [Symploca sp. SIO2D2]|nr:Uma2 family endonuclease [Symploca sp. SIO2D2]
MTNDKQQTTNNLTLELPHELLLQVTQEQFEALSAVNRDLRLERTAAGELIVNAAWVIRESWESLTRQQRKGFVPLCPDFVIELRSESDSLPKLQAKMREYIDNGAKLGWRIDPQNQRVEIYRAGREVEVLEHPSSLSGEDILPGFILKLKRVWI